MDSTATGRLEIDPCPVGGSGSRENARWCIDVFDERHVVANIHLVSISYHRDPFNGEYTKCNTDIINALDIDAASIQRYSCGILALILASIKGSSPLLRLLYLSHFLVARSAISDIIIPCFHSVCIRQKSLVRKLLVC